MVSRAQLLAGFGIGDAHGHAGQRMADRAGNAIAIIGVRRVHVGLGHAVAFEHGVAGARGPFAMGVGEQRRRAGNEQPHVPRGFFGQRRALQQAGIEGRHAHQHGRARHQLDDQFGIELRQEDHRGAGEQRDVARHEQAVGVIDRQRVDQHVVVGEAPVVDQRERVRREIVVRQHRALGAAGGARRVEDRGEIVVGARDRCEFRSALGGGVGQRALAVGAQRLDLGADLARRSRRCLPPSTGSHTTSDGSASVMKYSSSFSV